MPCITARCSSVNIILSRHEAWRIGYAYVCRHRKQRDRRRAAKPFSQCLLEYLRISLQAFPVSLGIHERAQLSKDDVDLFALSVGEGVMLLYCFGSDVRLVVRSALVPGPSALAHLVAVDEKRADRKGCRRRRTVRVSALQPITR